MTSTRIARVKYTTLSLIFLTFALCMLSCSHAVSNDENTEYQYAREWTADHLLGCIRDWPELERQYRNEERADFSLGPSVPSYWVQDENDIRKQTTAHYPIYLNGTPFAWTVVPSKESREKTNVDGNYCFIYPLTQAEKECLSQGIPCAQTIICTSTADADATTSKVAYSVWLLTANNSWIFDPDSSDIPNSGEQATSSEENSGKKPLANPDDMPINIIESIH